MTAARMDEGAFLVSSLHLGGFDGEVKAGLRKLAAVMQLMTSRVRIEDKLTKDHK
jgi:hypothetical protein